MFPHDIRGHAGSVVSHADEGARDRLQIGTETLESDFDLRGIRVVTVLHQFRQSNSVVLDELLAEHRQKAGVWADRDRGRRLGCHDAAFVAVMMYSLFIRFESWSPALAKGK